MNIGKSEKKRRYALMDSICIGEQKYAPIRAIPYDMKPLNGHLAGKKLDGILGYEFLSQYKIAINYKRKLMYVLPNALSNKVLFVLREK